MHYRYLLLLLLPIFAIIIYRDGQHYDPGLVNFQLDKSANLKIISYLPRKNGDYQRRGHIRSYSKDNLYEYVNGHAEFFISFGFVRLAVADYSSAEFDRNNPDFVVDVYDMGKSENAFGILMEESGENSSPVDVGFRGFLTAKTLNFIKGQYYIKITTFKENISIVEFAKKMEPLFGDTKNNISQFEKFPENGKIPNSVKFVKENYHGLSFASHVYEQGYNVNGEKFKAFLIEDGSEELLNKYFEFFKNDNIQYNVLEYKKLRYYNVSDPFEGNWFLIPMDKNLFGIYGAINENVLKSFIDGLKT